MSGAATYPASVTVSQVRAAPIITVAQGTVLPAPAPQGPYALSFDPSEDWRATTVNGAVVWTRYVPPPGQKSIGLEDGEGAIEMEDGSGTLVQEP